MELAAISEILGGERVLGQRIGNRMDLVELGSRGLTKDALSHLAKYMSFSWREMANLLPVTERTLQPYTAKRHLSTTVSEKVIQIAGVVAKGTDVFGGRDEFLGWLLLPSIALAGKTPFELLSSRLGTELVLDELGRIEHGIYS